MVNLLALEPRFLLQKQLISLKRRVLMPIYRSEKNKDYVVMSNVFLQRKDLSIKAKGLLAYMLSLPDDWKFTVGGLTSQLKECKSSVAAILDELERNGYLRRHYTRTAGGKIAEAVYKIFEEPVLKNPTLDKPTLEKPQAENLKTPLPSP